MEPTMITMDEFISETEYVRVEEWCLVRLDIIGPIYVKCKLERVLSYTYPYP